MFAAHPAPTLPHTLAVLFHLAAIAWEGKYKGRREPVVSRWLFAKSAPTDHALHTTSQQDSVCSAKNQRPKTNDGSQIHLHSLRINTLGNVCTVCRASASVA